jgi:hypothetical protein
MVPVLLVDLGPIGEGFKAVRRLALFWFVFCSSIFLALSLLRVRHRRRPGTIALAHDPINLRGSRPGLPASSPSSSAVTN